MWRKVGRFLAGNKLRGPDPFSIPVEEIAVNRRIVRDVMEHNAAEMRQRRDMLRGRRVSPFRFLLRYMGRHPIGHGIVLAAVLLAVACGAGTQYGMKHLIDVIS